MRESPEAPERPNIVILLADDLGFSDLGCYGGEIRTPHLDALASRGVRFTQFYNTPRCSPSRASLLTGRHPHQAGIGVLAGEAEAPGYPGDLSPAWPTLAEVLRAAGYGTYLSGKWHLSRDVESPSPSWPTRRGFDRFFGTIDGAGSYFAPTTLTRDEEPVDISELPDDFYYTDALGEFARECVLDHHEQRQDDPLFLYVAFTAPHWPLHAREGDVRDYATEYEEGWDAVRSERLARLKRLGIVHDQQGLSPRDPDVPPWDDASDKAWEAERMRVYAAQVTAMDRAVGRVLGALDDTGRMRNTLILFLSDNGGCAEEFGAGPGQISRHPTMPAQTRTGQRVALGNEPGIWPGPETTFASYGRSWANVSNTPFREYKHWVHEGGIASPLIAVWGAADGAAPGDLIADPCQLVDLFPTVLSACGAEIGSTGSSSYPGRDLLAIMNRRLEATDVPLFWEHEGNAGVRYGRWKLVRKFGQPWELYDMSVDRSERDDVAVEHPDLVAQLIVRYEAFAAEVGVRPWEDVVAEMRGTATTEEPH